MPGDTVTAHHHSYENIISYLLWLVYLAYLINELSETGKSANFMSFSKDISVNTDHSGHAV
jgi:hypothetical protein